MMNIKWRLAIRQANGLILSLILISAQTSRVLGAAAATAASQPLGSAELNQQAPAQSTSRQNYFGSHIGKLNNRGSHGISGDVYAVDEQTLFIRNFNYDGAAPDAYFWSSLTTANNPQDGFIVPDEKGSTKPLERYTNKDIVLRLPEGKTLREIQWLSIWSRQLRSSVGDIQIPHQSSQFVIPRPLEISAFSQLAHGLRSGPITIVDAQTFLVPDFHYDGLGPDAYFWLTRGQSGLSSQNSLKLKDENGSSGPLRKYQGETVVISLPDELTIYDFDFFGVWCKQFSANFGQTNIPQLARVPPSPKMLGIKPENKLNCEILYDELGFEIRWVLDGDDIVMQLVGKIEPGEYMAFGLGKDDSRSDMNNADAVVAWVERQTGQVQAVDYYLGAKQQCKPDDTQTEQGGGASFSGSCPDVKLPGGSDSLTLLHGAIVNGYSMVTFKRPQLGVDERLDQHVYSDGQQSVIWAIGTLNANKEVGYHRLRTKTNMFIDFARNPLWNCPIPDLNASMHNSNVNNNNQNQNQINSNSLPITSASQLDPAVMSANVEDSRGGGGMSLDQSGGQMDSSSSRTTATQLDDNSNRQVGDSTSPWFIPQVVCPMERTFYAQIGPSGGSKGYAGLTGRTGAWVPPVSWYINGLLIPELVVERGQAYRFIVEGGNDKLSSSRRHPLYLTDSPDGGFNFKTDEERMRERIYGGVAMRASDGQFVPTAEGRLCEWKPQNNNNNQTATTQNPDSYATFSAFQRSLKLDCLPGQASVLKFVPDANTPDTIYYQCYTNRLMGWKIRVVDSCAAYLNALQPAASQISSTRLLPLVSSVSNSSSKREVAALVPRRQGAMGKNKRRRADNAKVERRQSSDFDLKAQQSEQRMLTFDFAPQQQQQVTDQRQQEAGKMQQQAGLNSLTDQLMSEDDFLAASSPSSLEFGDELAASDDLPIMSADQAGRPNWTLPNGNSSMNLNASNWNAFNEQVLKMSPSELEFLDDSQLDLMGALALAASTNPQQQQQQFPNGQLLQMLPNFPLQQATQQQQQTNKTTMGKVATTGKLGLNRMPKSLHAYIRRLASFYYPVQQQLVSMLTPNSPSAQQANSQQVNQASQQQAAALAALHQQIVAASSMVPPTLSVHSNPTQTTAASAKEASSGEPQTSGSAPVSSFSLANLVPKPKIDLSKSNLSKKFNKFRIKSGRKQEANNNSKQQQQQQQAQQQQMQQQQQPRPPTPDNEFNYDIFNNQLMQLEQQQKQLQSLESFAAAATALVAASNQNPADQLHNHWPHQMQQQQQQQQQHNQAQGPAMFNSFYPNNIMNLGSNNGGLNGASPQQTSATPMSNLQLEQQDALLFSSTSNMFDHQNEPLDQQQSTLVNKQRVQPQQQQQQQAVFITKLNVQPDYFQMTNQQQNHQLINQAMRANQQVGGNQMAAAPTNGNKQSWRPPEGVESQFGQKQQSSRPQPSYLDSTDYFAAPRPQHQQQSSQNHQDHETRLQQSGSGGSSVQQQQQQSNGNTEGNRQQAGEQMATSSTNGGGGASESNDLDLDHMLAIERYSKQSSERAPPMVVHPVTGELVITANDQAAEQQQQQPNERPGGRPSMQTNGRFIQSNATTNQTKPRFSSMLIDHHVLAPSSSSSSASAELLYGQQSAPDLKRLNASEQVASATTEAAPAQAADAVLSRPNSGLLAATSPGPGAAELLDFFASEPPASATTPSALLSSTSDYLTSTSSSGGSPIQTTSSSAGPLVPSFGPPTLQMQSWPPPPPPPSPQQQQQQQQTGNEPQLVFKSNLIEPIKSTLVADLSASASSPADYAPRPFRFDSGPFRPLEMFATAASQWRQLRPPPLVESMLSQWQSPPRPEPPVQVASYLAQHLAAANQQQQQQQPQTSQQPNSSSSSSSISSLTPNTVNGAGAAAANQTRSSSHLIILKPLPLPTNQQQRQTYLLKPEYLASSMQQASNQQQQQQQQYQPGGDLFYTSAGGELVGRGRLPPAPVGHQFDRLSSLSSPPSTSMMLGSASGSSSQLSSGASSDPLLEANSMQTSAFQLSDHLANSANQQQAIRQQQQATPTTTTTTTSNGANDVTSSRTLGGEHFKLTTGSEIGLGQQRNQNNNNNNNNNNTNATTQVSGGKNIGVKAVSQGNGLTGSTYEPESNGGASGFLFGSSATQVRDNNTDNAILSHVMSLISANAVPAPAPSIMSNYANSDYFMPISNLDPAHPHQHLALLRSRSIRS